MKNTIITFLISCATFAIWNCNSPRLELVDTSVEKKDSITIESEEKSVNFIFKSLKINGQSFIQIKDENDRFFSLLTTKGDTIVEMQDFYHDIEILDINEDGYKDIRVFIVSNTPNQCDSYLFDKKNKTFQIVDGCDLDISKIKGTDFYYSYNRAGCADLNWESYLSKIENYGLEHYGYMNGLGCDFQIEKNPQLVKISKINADNDYIPLKELSYLKYVKNNDNKWDFIDTYWKQNYKSFDR